MANALSPSGCVVVVIGFEVVVTETVSGGDSVREVEQAARSAPLLINVKMIRWPFRIVIYLPDI